MIYFEISNICNDSGDIGPVAGPLPAGPHEALEFKVAL